MKVYKLLFVTFAWLNISFVVHSMENEKQNLSSKEMKEEKETSQGYSLDVGQVINSSNKAEDFALTHQLNNGALFGIFDGHIGKDASQYAASQFSMLFSYYMSKNTPLAALEKVFSNLESTFAGPFSFKKYTSGTTATVLFVQDDKLYLAHVGDSRAVIARKEHNSTELQAVQLTQDHTPHNQQERDRVEKAGCSVVEAVFKGKPKDTLWIGAPGRYPLTRSLGAAEMKRHYPCIIAEPQLATFTIDSNYEFLIIASDGLWDFIGANQTAVNTAQQLFDQKVSSQFVAKALAELARNNGSGDDIAVIVVRFVK